MKNLPNVTLLCVDCVEVERAAKAIAQCCEKFKFGEVKLLTSLDTTYPNAVKIPHIKSIQEYSKFMIKDLHEYVDTDYVMTIQWDAFILNPDAWDDEFLEYDYIGAPWWFTDKNVGNGAFTIRSKKLLNVLKDSKIRNFHPEDVVICRLYNTYLSKQGITYAPEELAQKFSFEGNQKYGYKWDGQLGFHDFQMTDVSKWVEQNKKEPELHVFYRYHTGDTGVDGISKMDCFRSYHNAFGMNTPLTVINDNCELGLCIDWKCEVHDISLGNAGSFIYQLELIDKLDDDDFVYFLEDDYLHDKDALKVLMEGLKAFPNDAVSLYDHPDKYQYGGPNKEITKWGGERTVVCKTESCHWKSTNSTTMTFAARVGRIKELAPIMKKFCTGTEIPLDYQMWKELSMKNNFVVWTSIPGYSSHCQEPWNDPKIRKNL